MTSNPEALFAAWATTSRRLSDQATGEDITAALTAATELARAVTADRWTHVLAALKLGVSGTVLAHALDMEVTELRPQFRGWCKSQRTLMRFTGRAGLTVAEADEALALMEQAITR